MFRHLYRFLYKPKYRRHFKNPTNGTLPITDSSLKVHLQAFAVALSKEDLMATDGSNFVSQWNASSATNINVTQSIQTQKPQYIDNLINGNPALSFDGVNDFLENSTTVPDFSVVTIFVVGAFLSNHRGSLVSLNNGSLNTGAIIFHNDTPSDRSLFRVVEDVAPFSDVEGHRAHEAHIYTGIADGVNAEFRIDLNSEGTTPAGTMDNTLSALNVGILGGGALFPLDGCVGEVAIYDRALSSTEIAQTETYLSEKWSIFFSLP